MSLKIFIAPLTSQEETKVKFLVDEETKKSLNHHQKENQWIKTLIFNKTGGEHSSSVEIQTVNESTILAQLKTAVEIAQTKTIVRLILAHENETKEVSKILETLPGIEVHFTKNDRMQTEQTLKFQNKKTLAAAN